MAIKKYDYILLGLHLESLYLARKLREQGKTFLILSEDSKPNESVFLSPIDSFFSSKEEGPFELTEANLPVLTYESAKWKDFLGFGEKAPEFDYSFLLQNPIYTWQEDKESLLTKWIEELEESLLFDVKFTNIEEDSEAIHIELNDKKNYHASNVIWLDSLREIDSLLAVDQIGKKNVQKLSKAKFWSRLDLQILHKETYEAKTDARFLLKGGNENAPAFYGQFYTNPEGRTCSQWSGFISSEMIKSGEELGDLLKELKRQIKRPFSELFSHLEFDKIQVITDVYSDLEWQPNMDFQLPGLQRLYVPNHNFHRFVHKESGFSVMDRLLETLMSKELPSLENP